MEQVNILAIETYDSLIYSINILLAIVHKLDAFNLKIEGKKPGETVTRTRLNVLMLIEHK
jgi:hypothetical protein